MHRGLSAPGERVRVRGRVRLRLRLRLRARARDRLGLLLSWCRPAHVLWRQGACGHVPR